MSFICYHGGLLEDLLQARVLLHHCPVVFLDNFTKARQSGIIFDTKNHTIFVSISEYLFDGLISLF